METINKIVEGATDKEIEKRTISIPADTYIATAMSKSLNFVLSREFCGLAKKEDDALFSYVKEESPSSVAPIWYRISRIGVSGSTTCKMYLDAIQRILHSCNEQTELLFLVKTNGKKVELFLGIRPKDSFYRKVALNSLSSYAQGMWKGLELTPLRTKAQNASIVDFSTKNNFNGKAENDNLYESVFAITGIPTAHEEDVLQMTIERFLSGSMNEDVSLLISANPLNSEEIEDSLYSLREVGGQVESMKTMTYSVGSSLSQSIQKTEQWNETSSKKDFAGVGKKIIDFVADELGFEPTRSLKQYLEPVVGATPIATGAIAAHTVAAKAAAASAAAAGVGSAGIASAGVAIGAVGLLSSFVPQKSTSHGGSKSLGLSKQDSENLSKTIINKHAEASVEKINRQIRRFEEGRACGMWNVGVYLFGDKADVTNAAYQLKAIVTGKSTELEPIRIHDITDLLVDNNPFKTINSPQIVIANSKNIKFEDSINKHNAELKTILTTKELTGYINFPLKPVPGLIVKDVFPDCSLYEPIYDSSIEIMKMGHIVRDGVVTKLECNIPIDRLTSHTLVSGINGSGKTNSILCILESLKSQQKPFLVIEPAKTEYIDWALKYNEELKRDQSNGKRLEEKSIRIFMPGRSNYKRTYNGQEFSITFDKNACLKLNPFEVIDLGEDSMNVLSHIDRVKSIFASAFPMQDILPVVLETALFYIYEHKGWFESKDTQKKSFPYMSYLLGCIDAVVDSLGYEEKNTMTIKAALKTRISSLVRGWKGELLDNISMSGISWKELFSSPCVINLSAVGDDSDKSFIMSLLMQYLYEYREAEASLSGYEYSNHIRHLVVIEEAHRIMSYCTNVDSPQYRSSAMFSTMLSEVRAFGQGLMVVDQVPTRLVPDAIKNTSLKIIHRLVSEDDINALSSASGLKQDRSSMISSLPVGEAIILGADNGIYSENNGEIYLCKIKKCK